MLAGRRVVLGITGGVAAYKAAYLARRLIENDAQVRTIMTNTARRFIGEATMAAITGSQPVTDLFSGPDVSPHTTLAAWADVVVIAPATASTIAKLAAGESSNALTATVLASTVPTVIAPAMHTEMWQHPATKDNIVRLESFGYHIVEPQIGDLAGGDVGIGRLAEPDDIVSVLPGLLADKDMSGLTVLVTAGGTREAIDPVRYIGNRSSGKMGNALASRAAARGANVILVTTAHTVPTGGHIDVVEVESAAEMAEAVWDRAGGCDVAVMAAAVADFRPSHASDAKIRRAEGVPTIDLEPTPDILRGINDLEQRPFLVGFAAEVGSIEPAIEKAERKGVDLMVANDVSLEGSGFGTETNQVTLIVPGAEVTQLPLLSKGQVADAIWDRVLEQRGRA
jgi:phosphopantothenoylcysteine decarboxylase/phosphopantothenate--cysteine ligase